MLRQRVLPGFLILLLASQAGAQGILSDLMAGKLVKPEVGAFAWYTLTDSTTNQEYFLRQAIVGVEKVKRKDAYWLETELVPRVGFPSVYKMLLTGPADDPDNIVRLIVREGQSVPQEIEVDRSQKPPRKQDVPRAERGTDIVNYPGGQIEAEHFIVNENGGKTELWVSDAVAPMGLVRMRNPQGELLLQRHGVGGKDGQSALPQFGPPEGDGAEAAEVAPKEEEKPNRGLFGRRKKK